MSTQETMGGPEVYRKIAKKQRAVLTEAVKYESVTKQRRILADYDQIISNNIKVLSQERLFENWEAYCFYSSSKELLSEMVEENSSDVLLNEKVSQQAVDFFTGGLKTQAVYLNTVEDYLDKVIDIVEPQAESFPVLQNGLQKAKQQVGEVSSEMEEFFQKSSGDKGFLRKLTTMPQRFLSRLGAGSTKSYQLEEAYIDRLITQSLLERKGSLGLIMSMLDENLITESILLTEVVDPVSIARGMSSMGQIVTEIGKLSARHGGRLLTNTDITSLVRLHPDIQRSTLENIVHIMGKNAQNVAGNPSAITPDLFQSVGRAMGWLPNNAGAIPTPPVPGITPIPGDGGGSFLTWLHKLWIKAMAYAKGLYAKMYAYLAPKLLALKAWLAGLAKGGIAAAKGFLGKAGSWLGSKWAALKGGLAAKGGVAGLAGKGLTGLKAGLSGLGAAAASPAAAGLAAIGGAAAAGKSLYSLMARRKKLENVFDFVKSLKNLSSGLQEGLVSEREIFSTLFKEADERSPKVDNIDQSVKLYAATLKKFVNVDELAMELATEAGAKLLQRIKSIPTPKVPTERYG